MLTTGNATFSWRELVSDKPLTDSDRRAFIEFKPILDYNALEPGKDATDAIRQAAIDLNFAGEYRRAGPADRAGSDRQRGISRPFRTARSSTASAPCSSCWSSSGWRCIRRRSSSPCSSICSSAFPSPRRVGLMMVGSLNLLSIAFAVLFVGLGVDFGIQYSVRYRSERFKNDDLLERWRRRRGVPQSRSRSPRWRPRRASSAFLPTDYKGISELGKIAGAGMLVAFISSITVLPALLNLLNPPGEEDPVGYAFLAPVDHFLEKHRVVIIVGTLLVAVAGSAAALFHEVRLQPDQLAQSEGRIDRDLPRSAEGSEHRRQRHQRDDEFGSRGEEDRGAGWRSCRRSSSVRSLDSFVPRGPAGKAEADRPGRQKS